MTDAAASKDDGFDAIAGKMLADEFRHSDGRATCARPPVASTTWCASRHTPLRR